VSTTIGRVEDLLLEMVKAQAGKRPEARVWELLERVTEEILLLCVHRARPGERRSASPYAVMLQLNLGAPCHPM
jgi:hypothetical protein